MPDEIKIDPTESFPHLPKAPIVEAAVDIRARAELPWEEKAIAEQLKERLPKYPVTLAQHASQQHVQFGPNQPPTFTSCNSTVTDSSIAGSHHTKAGSVSVQNCSGCGTSMLNSLDPVKFIDWGCASLIE